MKKRFISAFTSKEPFGHLRGGSFVRGFTLLQTIVIITSIAVALGAAYYLIDPVKKYQIAKDNQRKVDLAKIQNALKKFYADFGKYPQNLGDCAIDVNNCKIVGLDPDNLVVDWGEPFKPYIDILPKDPGGKTYIYLSSKDRQVYYLYASLDRGNNDRESCNQGNPCQSLLRRGLAAKVCGGTCNYGVSSPNVKP